MRCYTPIWVQNQGEGEESKIKVPCGDCWACLANKRAEWTFRLREEWKMSLSAFFVTLTYNDWHVPRNKEGIETLKKKDIVDYHKRLRKVIGKNVHKVERRLFKGRDFKYFNVGEYGEKTLRPHYHGIYFNIPASLMQELQDCWFKYNNELRQNGPIGYVRANELTNARIHYTTGYILTKKNKLCDQLGLEKPKLLVSKGIGENYSEDALNRHVGNKRFFIDHQGFKMKIPRYIKERWDDDEWKEEYLETVKKYAEDMEREKIEEVPSEIDRLCEELDRQRQHEKKAFKNIKNRVL